jgi:hypothetical protein
MTEFRSKLLGSESSGDYGVVQGKYVGGYQFGPARFGEFEDFLGREVSRDEFLRSPALQEQAMDWHERDILDYVGRSRRWIGMSGTSWIMLRSLD